MSEPIPVFYDDEDDAEDEGPICHKCSGTGRFVSCPDDMCHGQEECIHGDGDTCYVCGGTGTPRKPPAGPSAAPLAKTEKP